MEWYQLNHWCQWFFNGFSDSQPSVTMIFDGCLPLVQRCDGNNTLFQSWNSWHCWHCWHCWCCWCYWNWNNTCLQLKQSQKHYRKTTESCPDNHWILMDSVDIRVIIDPRDASASKNGRLKMTCIHLWDILIPLFCLVSRKAILGSFFRMWIQSALFYFMVLIFRLTNNH